MIVIDGNGEIRDAMNVIKDLQKICKKQRKEIKELRLQITTGRGSPLPDFENTIFGK